MTNERAIELLRRLQDEQFDGIHGDERREALEMAVRALEQNLVKESGDLVQDLVKDCISRQQAIDALDKHIDTFDAIDTNYLCGLRTAMSILKEMPSAQPETHDKCTETHACDLIGRQEAIDAICKACSLSGDYQKCDGYPEESTWCEELVALRALPSAQTHWIPCSERLPDEFGEYLVIKKAIGWNCEEYNSNDIAYFDNEGFHKTDKVLAWTPLPKPYGGKSDV